jgi:hypothetical protein
MFSIKEINEKKRRFMRITQRNLQKHLNRLIDLYKLFNSFSCLSIVSNIDMKRSILYLIAQQQQIYLERRNTFFQQSK